MARAIGGWDQCAGVLGEFGPASVWVCFFWGDWHHGVEEWRAETIQ